MSLFIHLFEKKDPIFSYLQISIPNFAFLILLL